MELRAGRRPVQERGRRRREAFLAAAAELLAREGWEGFTANAVAREAGASIGALYDYFPGREALVAGLFERYEVRLAAALDEALAGATGDWRQAADASVDVLARFWTDEPGYRAAWLGSRMEPVRTAASAGWSERFTERIAHLLTALVAEDAPLVARTAVHLVSGLLLAAATAPEPERQRLIGETRRALRAYLEADRGADPERSASEASSGGQRLGVEAAKR